MDPRARPGGERTLCPAGREVRMYSEHERVFYVEKMWSEGLRPASAHRLWGRPSRESLAAWERDALEGRLPAAMPPAPGACAHEKHARYPEETVAEALRLRSLGKPAGEVARMLGLPSAGTVRGWVRRARKCAKMSPSGRAEGAPTARGGEAVAAVADIDSMGEEELRAALRDAMERLDVMRAVVLDPKAAGLGSLTTRQRVEYGERLRRGCGLALAEVLSLLQMSKSTYEYNRSRILAGAAERGGDADIEALVAEVFEVAGGGARGYRFVHAELRRRGVACSEKRVRRVMRSLGLVPRYRRGKKRHSSYEGETDEGAPNLLLDGHRRHVFRAGSPFRLWLTDVTEFSIPAGKLYLSPIIDCLDGAPVAWSVSEHPDGGLAMSMLGAAVAAIPPDAAGLVLHSDRGGLYRMQEWKDACGAAGITRSMSRLGHSPDNARMEGFFGTMKNEMFHGRDWSQATLGELWDAIDSYMASYSETRLKRFFEGDAGPRGGKRGREVYDTVNGRRKRLGFPPAVAVNATPRASG